MVRTKKQIIDSIAIKNKQDESQMGNKQVFDKATGLHYSKTKNLVQPSSAETTLASSSDFYTSAVPASPLPTITMLNEKASLSFNQQPQIPTLSSAPLHYLDYSHTLENTWPPTFPQQSGRKLNATFSNLNSQEINEMMMDCEGNEDEAILRLITQTGYLEYIRHRISVKSERAATTYQPIPTKILPARKSTPVCTEGNLTDSSQAVSSVTKLSTFKPTIPEVKSNTRDNEIAHFSTTTNDSPTRHYKIHKKHHRPSSSNCSSINNGSGGSGGRLALDDALQQVQDSKHNTELDGYAGWSAARLRAYKMIEKNPNSYYYRFNAPGEQQKKGKWTEEENTLFLDRLKQVGANSQWGIFSIAIPGRVGYQCSNYYRFMIEMGQLHDPNYVLDEKGKARYLFDKKTVGGTVEKIFRKHSKHGSTPANNPEYRAVSKSPKKIKLRDEDDSDPTFSMKKTLAKKKTQTYTKKKFAGPSTTVQRVTRQSLQQHKERYFSDDDHADHVVPN